VRVFLLLVLGGCGGAVCTSNCGVTIDTFVHWTLVATEFLPFDGETCDGIGATAVAISLTGPTTMTQRVDCSAYQFKFSSLPMGEYAVRAMAFDAAGALTRGMASTTFTVADASQSVYVDFPFADFVKTYQGTYFFKTAWDGAVKCGDATPKVINERLLMERGGVALAGTTTDGVPIDGTKAGPCRDGGGAASQAVRDLDWGPAQITISGEDGAGNTLYRKRFDTFVGAGESNPSADFDVPSILPDAGVPDAAPPDAALADAG